MSCHSGDQGLAKVHRSRSIARWWPVVTAWAVLGAGPQLPAASIYRENNSNKTLNDRHAWVGNKVPTGTDIAVWGSNFQNAAGASKNLGGNVTWGQIKIENPGYDITIPNTGGYTVTLNGVAGTGIDLASATKNLTIDAALALGGAQAWTVGSGRTLTIGGAVANGGYLLTVAGTGNTTLSGVVSGTGGLTKTGAGALTLSGTGANTFSGATTVNEGLLLLNKSAGLNAIAGALTINSGGTNRLLAANQIADASVVTVNGTGRLDLNGFTETIGALAGNGSVALGSATLTVGDATDTTFAGIISGTGGLTKQGVGLLTLSGGNTFSGGVAVNAGTLAVAGGAALANGVMVTIAASAALRLEADETIAAVAGSGQVDLQSHTLTVGTTDSTFAGAISGTGGLAKSGGGVLTLTGSSDFSGGTWLGDGRLVIGHNHALGSGAVTMAGGTLSVAGSRTLANEIVLASASAVDTDGNSLTLAGTVSGAANLTKTGAGTLTLLATNTASGTFTISQGRLVLAQAGGLTNATIAPQVTGGLVFSNATRFEIGGLTGAGSLGLTNTSGTGVALVVGNNGAHTTFSGVLSGSGSLTKTGGGRLELTTANTYSGGTVLESGTLLVNNTTGYGLGSGPLTVAGGTLGGTGRVSGAVVVNSGGRLAPGNSIGIQHVGTLTLNTGSVLNWEFQTGPSGPNDQIIVDDFDGLTINGAGFNLLTENGTSPIIHRFTDFGLYNLIQYTGTLKGLGITALSVLNPAGNRTYAFGDNAGWITLTIGGQGVGWTGTAGLPSGPWYWTEGGNWNVAVAEGDQLIFDGNTGVNNINDFAPNTWFSGIVFTNTAGAFTLNGAALNLRGTVENRSTLAQTINLPLVLDGGSRIVNTLNGDLTVNGVISEASSGLGIIKTGSKTLVLTATNTYTGATEIQGGAVRATDGAGLPTASNLKINGAVFESSGTFSRSLGTGGGQVQWTGSGGFSAYGGTLNVNIGGSAQTLTWGSTAGFANTNAALIFSSSGANGTVKFINPLDLNGGVRTVQVANSSATVDAELAGAVTGSAGSGLAKTGAGTLLLTGNNTYAGRTEVNAGTLLVGGTLTAGGDDVTVVTSATLGGHGTVARTVNLQSGSTLAPGQSGAGVLTVGALTLADGFVYDWQLGSITNDWVSIANGGTIDFAAGDRLGHCG